MAYRPPLSVAYHESSQSLSLKLDPKFPPAISLATDAPLFSTWLPGTKAASLGSFWPG
jgi:hypothetical protein